MLFTLVVTYIGMGLLFMGISVPMIRGKVKPNHWYGFRTPKTLSSPEIWYPANAYSGRLFFLVGVLTSISAVFLLPLAFLGGRGEEIYSYAVIGIMVASLIWCIIKSTIYLNRL